MARILIVDDSAFLRLRISRTLTAAGHATAEADCGRCGVQAYEAEAPDLVLMDITMPGMDGLRAVSAIRELDPRACIAMLTAMGQPSIVVDALRRGARDFITKPFTADRLLATVAKLLVASPAEPRVPAREGEFQTECAAHRAGGPADQAQQPIEVETCRPRPQE